MEDFLALETDIIPPAGVWQLLIRFALNMLVVGLMIHFFYYPKSRRRDYYFTFTLISVSVFFLVFLLGSVSLKIGFALGIFAIFGIIRYRTESVPIREMTYLFAITAISVINALSVQIGIVEILVTNLIFLLVTWVLESGRWLKHTSSKLILYDKIELITPDKYEELKADLTKRTGLQIKKIEVGHIDFLRDAAFLKVYYESDTIEENTVDNLTRFPREEVL
ncbi:DUF4956 domain-containing protein [Parabacteroides sp. OttesenSCG-928-G07]|nr:DUF4956 domain-containing protein [Parabacteroides sp. OttesenSCG-928-G07]